MLDKLFILKKVCRDGLFAEEMLDLQKFSLLTMMKNCSSVNKIEQWYFPQIKKSKYWQYGEFRKAGNVLSHLICDSFNVDYDRMDMIVR